MVTPNDKHFLLKILMLKLDLCLRLVCIIQVKSISFYHQIITNSVTVNITKVAGKFTNLKQLGYFVVVGVEQAFISLGLKSVEGDFSSGLLEIKPNRWFALAVQGFNYLNTDNIRIKALYTYTATTMSYLGCVLIYCRYNYNEILKYQVKNTNSYTHLECCSIGTSRKQVIDLSILPTFYLELVQTNQIYTDNGNYDYVVDKSIAPLRMNIQVKSESNKKIQVDVNKCNSCSQQTHSFAYDCFNQMNYVGFFPLIYQAFQQYNKLKISIQSSSLEIIYVVYDQTITEKTIVKIQIVDE